MLMNWSRCQAGTATLCVTALSAAALVACGGGGSAGSTDVAASSGDTSRLAAQAGPVSSTPILTCDTAGIGSVSLVSDLPTLPTTNPPNSSAATITSVSTGTTGAVSVLSGQGAGTAGDQHLGRIADRWHWNGRLQSEGGGGYAGSVGVPTGSIAGGYVGVQTDTGHTGGSGTLRHAHAGAERRARRPAADRFRVPLRARDGGDRQATRASVLRPVAAVLVLERLLDRRPPGNANGAAFPERLQRHSGGRAGVPLGPLPGVPDLAAGRDAARRRRRRLDGQAEPRDQRGRRRMRCASTGSPTACIRDPRVCTYNPVNDATITKASCTSADNTCLTPGEASAIQKIWGGATNASGKLLWPGVERGAALSGLAGGAIRLPSLSRSRSSGSTSIRAGTGRPSPTRTTRRSSRTPCAWSTR